MIFFVYEIQRKILTLLCKIFANFANILKASWTIVLLDFCLKERGKTLGKESVYCMRKTRKWQKKAELCIAAFHYYEKECKK